MEAMPPFESRAGDAGRLVGRGLFPRARFHLVLLLLAFALVLSASVAGASAAVESSGGFKYVTKGYFVLKPGGPRTKKAACPNGTHVLSGGHFNVGGFGDVIGAHSYPYDGDDGDKLPDDGWAAQLRAFGDPVPASVHAICTRRVFPEYAKHTDGVDLDGEEDLITATCDPPSLDVTGGGSRGPALVREVESYPSSGAEWTMGLANHGDADKDVTVYAICAPLPQDGFGADAPVSALADQQTLSEVACPPSAPHVVGGGVQSGGSPLAKGLTAIAATRPGSDLSSWRVWMDNYGDVSPVMFAEALCSAPL